MKDPKHYFPGDAFNYNFDKCQINQSKKEAFNRELKFRKNQITISFKKLFQKKHLTMKSNSLLCPCYFKNCNFQGHNLKRHFESKAHLMPSESAKLHQSYLTHQVNYLTKVSKLKQNPPALCSKCHHFLAEPICIYTTTVRLEENQNN